MLKEKRKIKIGIDCHSLEGKRTGVGRYLKNILEEFTKIEKVKQNFLFYLYFKKEIPKDIFLKNKIFIKKVIKFPFFKPSFTLFFLALIPYYYKKDNLNLFWFPSYMIPITFRGKAIITIHDIVYERYPETVPLRYLIFYKIFSRYGAKISKKIITVSEFSKMEIKKLYKIPSKKIEVTPLGIDKILRKSISKKDALFYIRKKYKIKDKYILYLGQIFTRRKLKEIISAFSKIAYEFKNYQFLIIGKNRTSPYFDIDKYCKSLNKKFKRKVFLRKEYADENDILYLYKGADLFIYLSDYEGFGLPPLEAQAVKTPVITSLKPPFKKIIKGGYFIKNNDSIKEISDAIKKILKDKNLRNKMIKTGYKNSLKFNFKTTAEKTFKIIEKICFTNY